MTLHVDAHGRETFLAKAFPDPSIEDLERQINALTDENTTLWNDLRDRESRIRILVDHAQEQEREIEDLRRRLRSKAGDA